MPQLYAPLHTVESKNRSSISIYKKTKLKRQLVVPHYGAQTNNDSYLSFIIESIAKKLHLVFSQFQAQSKKGSSLSVFIEAKI